MLIFLDTADLDEIKAGVEMGLVDGVTTNPSLIARTGKTFEQIAPEIVKLVDGPISLEVISDDALGMVKEGRELSGISENVVVKIPMTMEGLKAVRILEEEGIHTNVTLVFSAMQAYLAAKAGASYVSPFIGRLDDLSSDGMDLVSNIMQIFENYEYMTQVIVASVRSPMHVLESALVGADIVTVPFKTLTQLFKHPMTDIGIEKFKKDFAAIPK